MSDLINLEIYAKDERMTARLRIPSRYSQRRDELSIINANSNGR